MTANFAPRARWIHDNTLFSALQIGTGRGDAAGHRVTTEKIIYIFRDKPRRQPFTPPSSAQGMGLAKTLQ